MGHLYELLVHDDDLYCCVDEGVDVASFARCFAAAWSAVPLAARQAILTYWRPQLTHPRALRFVPTIRYGRMADPRWGAALAGCSPPERLDYRLLCFQAPVVELLPDRLKECLVAHELAHVLLRAYNRHNPAYDRRSGVTDPEEMEVDKTIAEWGFDGAALRQWCTENRSELDDARAACLG